MKSLAKAIKDLFVSLQLTVFLLALSIVLIFWATLSQTDLGVWGVQQKFFHSIFILWKIPGTQFPLPIFPGGYLIGGLLLINLVAAQCYRLKYSWRKSGIWLTHLGLILLLVGELLSGLQQKDYFMQLGQNQSGSYAESERNYELAVIDETDPKTDLVVAIPERLLADGGTIQRPELPFRIVPKLYYENSEIQGRNQSSAPTLATTGVGTQVDVIPQPLAASENTRNLPAAYVELDGPNGAIGTWLVSAEFTFLGAQAPFLAQPQRFTFDGRHYRIALRSTRQYFPFSVTLLKFSHDIYPGSDIPKNFSSKVHVDDPVTHEQRDVLIYMNNPLRYGGFTFYQADYDHQADKYTVLQVVRNPSWRIPYIACTMIMVGLVIQFVLSLMTFGRRRRAAANAGEVTA